MAIAWPIAWFGTSQRACNRVVSGRTQLQADPRSHAESTEWPGFLNYILRPFFLG